MRLTNAQFKKQQKLQDLFLEELQSMQSTQNTRIKSIESKQSTQDVEIQQLKLILTKINGNGNQPVAAISETKAWRNILGGRLKPCLGLR